MEERHSPDPNADQETIERLASVLNEELRKGGTPAVALDRLASRPSLVRRVVEMASADLVTVPNLSAPDLLALVRDRVAPKSVDFAFTRWDFNTDRHGQALNGPGQIFEVLVWTPQAQRSAVITAEAARSELAAQGFVGHVGAFLAWHLSLGDRQGQFACIPDADNCYFDPRGKPWVPYSYTAPGNVSFHVSPVTETWDHPFAFVGFRPFTGRP